MTRTALQTYLSGTWSFWVTNSACLAAFYRFPPFRLETWASPCFDRAWPFRIYGRNVLNINQRRHERLCKRQIPTWWAKVDCSSVNCAFQGDALVFSIEKFTCGNIVTVEDLMKNKCKCVHSPLRHEVDGYSKKFFPGVVENFDPFTIPQWRCSYEGDFAIFRHFESGVSEIKMRVEENRSQIYKYHLSRPRAKCDCKKICARIVYNALRWPVDYTYASQKLQHRCKRPDKRINLIEYYIYSTVSYPSCGANFSLTAVQSSWKRPTWHDGPVPTCELAS